MASKFDWWDYNNMYSREVVDCYDNVHCRTIDYDFSIQFLLLLSSCIYASFLLFLQICYSIGDLFILFLK